MEELLANAHPENQLLYTLITGFLLFGGVLAALFLALQHRKKPLNYAALTDKILTRSWAAPQIFILLGSLFLLYFIASFVGLFFGEEQIPLAQLVATVIIYLLIIALITLLDRQRGGSWETHYGMGFRQIKKILIAPLFYLALIPFLMLASTLYSLLLESVFGIEVELQAVALIFTQEFSWLQFLYIFMAIFVAPIYEELIFRGVVFPFLVKRGGLAGGTALVSLLFALMHFHLPSLVPLFLLSAALCLAYWRTGSLWVSIGMHTLFNAVSIFALKIVA